MKKLILLFIIAVMGLVKARTQCGLNYQQTLDKFCQGVYLKHMEPDNYSEDSGISLVLKKNNRYAFYILNPSHSIPVYKLSSEKNIPVSNEIVNYSRDNNYASYSFDVNETCIYHFTYSFNTDKPACFLLAIYLQNTVSFEPGLYKTFEELKYNNPSVKLNFDITSKTQQVGIGKNAEKVTNYRLDLSRYKAKSIGTVYGFSDGSNIYFNVFSGKRAYGKDFVKVHMYNKYGYFASIDYRTIVAGSVVTTSAYVVHNLIDMNTGEIIMLNNKKMREIMADDKELLDAFENESRKQIKMKEYILKYLEKNH
jgi:hypothetical protein